MSFTERTDLLVGREKLKRLAGSTVLVFGIGGVGSYTAEALVRAGVGTVILVDNDTVSESNINRQLLALRSTVGMKKIDAARERYMDINPDLKLYTYDHFILPENCEEFFESISSTCHSSPDYVCDCIDTVSGKLAIIEYCIAKGIPVISCMGTGNKLHPELFRISDISKTNVCPLCRVMRKELKERNINHLDVLWSDEQPVRTGGTVSSISYVPGAAGLMLAAHITERL